MKILKKIFTALWIILMSFNKKFELIS
jgi:hypothetical protein